MQRSADLVIAITRGLIRSQQSRRSAMFGILIAALVMLFCGSTFLSGLLREHPVGFIFYWAACAWLTLTSVLLALFDLVAVRAQARREKQQLKAKIFGAHHPNDV